MTYQTDEKPEGPSPVMSKTIERVAEAMYATRVSRFRVPHGRILKWEELPDNSREYEREAARSALLALEGAVSDEMVEAAVGPWPDRGDHEIFREQFRAAIQAALKAAGE